MSRPPIACAPRRLTVLAAIIGIHVGVLGLVAAGLTPRSVDSRPTPTIVLVRNPPAAPPEESRPRAPGPVDYAVPREPEPVVRLPEFDEPAPRTMPAPVSTGAGPALPVPERDAPRLRSRDGRLAALIAACYPSASRRLAEEGRVVVSLDIDAVGQVSALRIVASSGFARLDAAASCVVRRLEFHPGGRDGEAVAATVSLPIVFRLD